MKYYAFVNNNKCIDYDRSIFGNTIGLKNKVFSEDQIWSWIFLVKNSNICQVKPCGALIKFNHYYIAEKIKIVNNFNLEKFFLQTHKYLSELTQNGTEILKHEIYSVHKMEIHPLYKLLPLTEEDIKNNYHFYFHELCTHNHIMKSYYECHTILESFTNSNCEIIGNFCIHEDKFCSYECYIPLQYGVINIIEFIEKMLAVANSTQILNMYKKCLLKSNNTDIIMDWIEHYANRSLIQKLNLWIESIE